MTQMWGANIEELENMATQLSQAADTLDALVSRITASFSSLQWVGNDADMSREIWYSKHKPYMLNCISSLRQAVSDLKYNAQQQWIASGYSGNIAVVLPIMVALKNAEGLFAKINVNPAEIAKYIQGLHVMGISNELKKLETGISASWSGKFAYGPVKTISGSTNVAGVHATGTLSGYAQVYGTASANGSISMKGIALAGTVTAGALVGVSAAGSLSNRYFSASGSASLEAGAQATATGSLNVGSDGIKEDGSAGAFVGVEAKANETVSVAGGAASETGHVGVTAGFGIQGHESASFTPTDVGFSFGGKVSVGVGVSGGISLHVDPQKILTDVTSIKLPFGGLTI